MESSFQSLMVMIHLVHKLFLLQTFTLRFLPLETMEAGDGEGRSIQHFTSRLEILVGEETNAEPIISPPLPPAHLMEPIAGSVDPILYAASDRVDDLPVPRVASEGLVPLPTITTSTKSTGSGAAGQAFAVEIRYIPVEEDHVGAAESKG